MRKLLVALLGLALSTSALAKDNKKKKDDEGILPTHIASFDRVFTRVGEIDRKLTKSEGQIRSAKTNLNTALGLKRNTPISTGLAQLRQRAEGKLQLSLDNKAVPKLQTSDAVPPNVKSAVDAVNAMTSNFSVSISELTGLGPEIDSLIKDTRKMPENLKKEFSKGNSGLLDTLFKLPKTSKALTHDIGITKGLPGRTTSLTNQMTGILGDVKSEFAPGGPRKPASTPAKGKTTKGGSTNRRGTSGGSGGSGRGGNSGSR